MIIIIGITFLFGVLVGIFASYHFANVAELKRKAAELDRLDKD
tara:strand:+ start:2652 stop:2780 length:129 start_codon:yes stop_codon:yes gene_type:complete